MIEECVLLFDDQLFTVAANNNMLRFMGIEALPKPSTLVEILEKLSPVSWDVQSAISRLNLLISANTEVIAITPPEAPLSLTFRKYSSELFIVHFKPGKPESGFEYFLEQSAFLNRLAQVTQEIYYIQDIVHDEFLFMSDNVSNQLGYSIDEVNKIKFHKIIRKIEKAGVSITSALPAIPGGSVVKQAVKNEYLLQTKDGSQVWYEEQAVKIKDKKGKNIGQLGVLKNLSETKVILQSLKEANKSLVNHLTFSPVGILVVQNEKIVFANTEAAKILGTDNSSVLLKESIHRFSPPATLEKHLQLFEEIRAKRQKHFEFQDEFYNLKNEKITMRVSAIPMQFEGTSAFQIIFKDVTAENLDIRIKKTINQILEASDAIGDLQDFYAFIHKSITTLLPAKNFFIALSDRNTGMLAFAYLTGEIGTSEPIPLSLKSRTQLVLRTRKSWLIDRELNEKLCAEGELDPAEKPVACWLGVPLIIKKEAIGAIVLQDYTDPLAYSLLDMRIVEPIAFSISQAIERKSQERERLQLVKQLEETNAAKDKLFSLVSHDLRTPFSSIIGFVNILLNEYGEMPQQEALAILTSLKRVSTSAYDMLTNLLEFSRFQRGYMTFDPEYINLNEIIANSIELVRGTVDRKKLTIVVQAPDSILPFADKKMISSVMQNLLSNAIKFSPHNTTIEITVEPGANEVWVNITDQGVGMTDEEMGKLFHLDTIHSTYGTDSEIGAGLGLMLVHDFVLKNNGQVSVKSNKNKGTTFSFSIPLSE